MTPIALRTRNRPVYLDVTLKSILATSMNGCTPFIIDDCSDDVTTRRYLDTNEFITLGKPVVWPISANWHMNIGSISDVCKLRGIAGKLEVVRPERRKGVKGGVFWCIDYLFTHAPNEDYVILIEADAVFHRDWLTATIAAYEACKDLPGPNGNRLGLLSCYDRKGTERSRQGWCWRSVKDLGGGRWGCGNGIGGVMYLVTRGFYQATQKEMKYAYDMNARGGDTTLQGLCGKYKFNIAVTTPSFCQHIGLESTAWPEKGWRYTRNFRQPFSFLNEKHWVECSGRWNDV